MSIEMSTTLEEEALDVLWRWSASRRKKNTGEEGSANTLPPSDIQWCRIVDDAAAS